MGLWDKVKKAIGGSKSSAKAPADPIDAFWDFWSAHKDTLATAIAGGTLDKWTDRINERVVAVHAELGWEFGKGVNAEHYFCVTAEGDMRVRVAAERWFSHAPRPDDTWEYHPARPGGGVEGTSLTFTGVTLDADSFRVQVELDSARLRAHTTLYHPAFADTEQAARMQASFIMLDGTLGEDDVERWIGAIETTCDEPADGIPLAELPAAIQPLIDSDEDSHTIFERETEAGMRTIAMVRVSVKRVDHLLFDSLVTIVIPLSPQDDGLPDGDELGMLNDAEDDLLDRLGPNAVFVGHETGEGRRTIYLHASTTGPVLDLITAWEGDHGEFEMDVETTHDPEWEVLDRW